jgi:hypothetical protein
MEYQLIIKIPFEEIDDVEARKDASSVIGLISEIFARAEYEYVDFKLQKVFKDKKPEGIQL